MAGFHPGRLMEVGAKTERSLEHLETFLGLEQCHVKIPEYIGRERYRKGGYRGDPGIENNHGVAAPPQTNST